MALDATSHLSPHLRFGEISPRQAWDAVAEAIETGDITATDGESFLRELLLLDFADFARYSFRTPRDFTTLGSRLDAAATTTAALSYAHPLRLAAPGRFSLGATVKAQWATLGHFDFINVVEAPDEKTMARVSLELGSRGTAHYESLAAIPIDDFIASL